MPHLITPMSIKNLWNRCVLETTCNKVVQSNKGLIENGEALFKMAGIAGIKTRKCLAHYLLQKEMGSDQISPTEGLLGFRSRADSYQSVMLVRE